MPVHDWTRVSDATFHDFHYSWVLEIKRALKRELDPAHYVMVAQLSSDAGPQRTLVIRHTSDDRIVAMIEILSPGNKSSRNAIRAILDKSVAAIDGGIHRLLVDVHPPGPRDPQGIHGALMAEISSEDYSLPGERQRTVVAYIGGPVIESFVRHFSVGEPVPTMPLFLTKGNYVNVPLEPAYLAAFEDVPPQYQSELAAP